MEKEELKSMLNKKLDFANRVLNGDTEYDGADAAREIRDICEEVLKYLS
jgi:hypothetical protein